ncbi:MAG: dihydropteroate synthase [Candidatus Omnitrophica bacterium]|nr:dihydropteroate synthase [Candidatus Omnitrophota bacterium]
MRILHLSGEKELRAVFHELKVDPCGIDIMLLKALPRLIRLNGITCIAATILKQEMLSLGGDAALPRAVLTGKVKKTDCILIGTVSQFLRLREKLQKQPFGLNKIGDELSRLIAHSRESSFKLRFEGFSPIALENRTAIMGIANVTPDSFSGDGFSLKGNCFDTIADAIQTLERDGADIIDIGGESTRPGAKPVSLREELFRTIPIIKLLSKRIKVPLSIDTRKPEVALQALDNGAVIINDISGLKSDRMIKIAARYKAGVVIMHMQGDPRTMQKSPSYQSVMDEILAFFSAAIQRAESGGIAPDKIIIDPGIGFGKTFQHNREIFQKLPELRALGKPVLIGPSRKVFIGEILKKAPQERDEGTAAVCVAASLNGASIVRVHNVKRISEALAVSDAVMKAG